MFCDRLHLETLKVQLANSRMRALESGPRQPHHLNRFSHLSSDFCSYAAKILILLLAHKPVWEEARYVI